MLSICVYLLLGIILFPQHVYGKKSKNKPNAVVQGTKYKKKLQVTQDMIEAAKEHKFTWLAVVLSKLQSGKEVNINELDPKDELSPTALYQAAALGNLAIVQLLLNQGAKI